MDEQKKKVFILLEGVTDIRVITDLILCNHKSIERPKKDLKEITLENQSLKVVLKSMGGWAFLTNEEILNDINQKNEEGYTCLVILDADDESKDLTGGTVKRKALLEKLKIEKKLDFESFLLPDNKTDGDLEDILVKAIPDERQNIFSCIESYRDCLNKNLNVEQEKKKLVNKNILYNYYAKLFDEKERPLFDFDREAFDELKKYLTKHLS
jgi:hypothetical protein